MTPPASHQICKTISLVCGTQAEINAVPMVAAITHIRVQVIPIISGLDTPMWIKLIVQIQSDHVNIVSLIVRKTTVKLSILILKEQVASQLRCDFVVYRKVESRRFMVESEILG